MRRAGGEDLEGGKQGRGGKEGDEKQRRRAGDGAWLQILLKKLYWWQDCQIQR